MFDQIDPRSAIALDVQIATRLRRAISEGELRPGDGLPSARQLAARLRINPAAVVLAYGELEQERLVEVRPSVGTFVRQAAAKRVASDGSPAAAQSLAPGQLVSGRYEIKAVLGVGGMGVVYRAFDRELRESIAIKVLPPEMMRADANSLERFKQEIRLARRISHRNVLRTHDLGEIDGTYYITMEFAEGSTLADLITMRGQFSVDSAITLGKQLCLALEAAHGEGVVHRDIKPQNLMLDGAGVLKVMDFGIARIVAGSPRPPRGLTEAGTILGTLDYMSPEQLMNEPLDGRADLYAAGAVLFECLTGRPVFMANTSPALIAAHLNEAPTDPRSLNAQIPAWLSEVILRALAKDREQRWASAGEMHRALERTG